jgi:hypothetical protein
MSGKTGSGAAIGAGLGILAGVALAPFTAGTSLAISAGAAAALGGGAGLAAGGAVGGASDAKSAARKLTAQFNNSSRQEQKPTIPTQDSEAIRNSRNVRALNLSQRSGRASTFLTDKFGG